MARPRRNGAALTSGVAKRAASNSQRSRASPRPSRAKAGRPAELDIYNDMLTEANVLVGSSGTTDVPERPLKRPRMGKRPRTVDDSVKAESDEEEEPEFEDVAFSAGHGVQTKYRDSDSDDEVTANEDDAYLEDVDFDKVLREEDHVPSREDRQINLTLNTSAGTSRRAIDRRKPLTRAEKQQRIQVHQLHLLSLILHTAKRNHWCNDAGIQETLLDLLTEKNVKFLNPSLKLPQFGRTESLKRGVQEAAEVFRNNFTVTERGMRKALWAEDEDHLESYELPDDADSCLTKADFRKSATSLTGSRDVGAQLFCSLLRASGVEARLVCSLQPLAFTTGGPSMPKPRLVESSPVTRRDRINSQPQDVNEVQEKSPEKPSFVNPRSRLGHPDAAGYNVPDTFLPKRINPASDQLMRAPIKESAYPVYWVEVFDEAHSKWQPVDPLVTHTQWQPHKLEPPASDRENLMSYAIAFEADGSAKDVTRRYVKAYNSKTKRQRIDGPTAAGLLPDSITGEQWWRAALKLYKRHFPSVVDTIEDQEFSLAEAHEPMPRNVQDFKNHPVYALERHLSRYELIIPEAVVAGTVGAGSRGPLEKIYRRRDVRSGKSPEKWYRLGREIKLGEEPVKILPKKANKKRNVWDDHDSNHEEASEDEDPVLRASYAKIDGTPLFTFDQTSLYVAQPVVNGRIPKNKFGNLDVFVPSMVPPGGVYITDDHAAHAAHILGVDYAPALTGFSFKGRKGTAVLQGAVVAEENAEAVYAVIEGMGDLEQEMEDGKRSRRAVRMWARLLRALRIRDRVWAGVNPDEEHDDGAEIEAGGFQVQDGTEEEPPSGHDDVQSDVTEEFYMNDDDDGGGGFMVE